MREEGLLSARQLEEMESLLDLSEDPLDHVVSFYCRHCNAQFDYPDELRDHEDTCNWWEER